MHCSTVGCGTSTLLACVLLPIFWKSPQRSAPRVYPERQRDNTRIANEPASAQCHCPHLHPSEQGYIVGIPASLQNLSPLKLDFPCRPTSYPTSAARARRPDTTLSHHSTSLDCSKSEVMLLGGCCQTHGQGHSFWGANMILAMGCTDHHHQSGLKSSPLAVGITVVPGAIFKLNTSPG